MAGKCAESAQPSTIDVDNPTHRLDKAANPKVGSKQSLKMLIVKTEHATDEGARPDLALAIVKLGSEQPWHKYKDVLQL